MQLVLFVLWNDLVNLILLKKVLLLNYIVRSGDECCSIRFNLYVKKFIGAEMVKKSSWKLLIGSQIRNRTVVQYTLYTVYYTLFHSKMEHCFSSLSILTTNTEYSSPLYWSWNEESSFQKVSSIFSNAHNWHSYLSPYMMRLFETSALSWIRRMYVKAFVLQRDMLKCNVQVAKKNFKKKISWHTT